MFPTQCGRLTTSAPLHAVFCGVHGIQTKPPPDGACWILIQEVMLLRTPELSLNISPKQQKFIAAQADEVLFGGAAGGGKSYAQVIDTLLYAMKYAGSRQLLLRRKFPELERSIIRTALEMYPAPLFKYNTQKHSMTFVNGSIVDFGFCENENDVFQYKSSEYDVIRFDELTTFTEFQYTYMISRNRGANDFPKCMKSSTNPGEVGHAWVKARFIDIGAPNVVHEISLDEGGISKRIFIPSKVDDNIFLMAKDPGYKNKLLNLPEEERKALLYGEWDIFKGQYFTEFDREVHAMEPFPIPEDWRRYVVFDYGRDMLACYWIAMDMQGRAYVYRELYKPGLIVSAAAEQILLNTPPGEPIFEYIAPPDLWNKHNDSGKSTAELMAEMGIFLVRSSNNRVQGWYNLREWLKIYNDEQDRPCANLRFFNTCPNLIRCLTAIQYDRDNPNDVSDTPHELTHAPDAIRYFVSSRPLPTGHKQQPKKKIWQLEDNDSFTSGVMDW